MDRLEPAESAGIRRLRAWLYASTWSLLALSLWFWPSWRLLEEQVRDALTVRFALTQRIHPSVVLVDFSDDAIQALGGWPLPRDLMADLVEELIGPLGARVVGLDMVFPEAADATGDARLASLARHGPLVLAHVLDMQQRSNPIRVGMPALGVEPPRQLAGRWSVQPSFGYVANHSGLADARCVGHVGVTLDADGVVRRLSPLVQGPHGVLNTLAAAMIDCGEPRLNATRSSEGVVPTAPSSEAAAWRLPFRLGMSAFDALKADDVLSGRVDADRVRGRYVLVGSSAVGLSDYVTTPLQALTPGVMVHAQALAELLDHGTPLPDNSKVSWLLLPTLVVGFFLWWLWQRHKALAWLLAMGWTVLWPVLVVLGYRHGVFLWALYPVALSLGALGAVTALEFKLVRDVKRRALNTLSHYVAAPVLEQLYDLGLTRSLQPKLQNITVMVVDMRDYTRLTSEMSLYEVATLTRDFLALITQPVLDHEGTLDRYSGDGLIAFWGAPLPQGDHADRALSCADALRDALERWNSQRQNAGLEPISMRIGIESGRALVGDVGNAARSLYTAVGLCINTASRLQEMGRQLQADLVVGPQSAALCQKKLKPLAVVQVKGLREPLQVFTRLTP